MPASLSPILQNTAITDREGLITSFFRLRWEQLRSLIQNVPSLAQVTVAARSTALGSTLLLTTPGAGWYRVSVYTEIATAATVNSAVTVTMTWTHNAKSMTHSFPSFTDNDITHADLQTGLILADNATPIQVSATYASVGATALAFALAASVEREV